VTAKNWDSANQHLKRKPRKAVQNTTEKEEDGETPLNDEPTQDESRHEIQ
jgi:hypothetical protein